MRKVRSKLHLFVFGLALVLAAFIRFRVAPLSAGPDVAQFWAFAEVFRLHGLDFYRYASAQIDIFPFKYWAYVYPPIWLLVLGLALLIVPSSLATSDMVDASWRLAMKTPIILADLAIGVLLYWAVPGSKYRKLLFACLWLFNPAAWYNSAVFGQFDAIATAFLVASIVMLERGKDRAAFVLAALAGLTKQHTFIPVAFMVAICARQMSWRRLTSNVAIMAGMAALLSIPFLLTGNFLDYFRSILFPGQAPDYQYPLMYAFNGSSAVLTYLHNVYGWETVGLMRFSIPLLAISIVGVAVLCYIKRISILRAALVGILLFIIIFYRINYQYLLIFIPLVLWVASRTPYKTEKALALALALFPATWLWMINVVAWFVDFAPTNQWVAPIFERIGLTHQDIPDYAYVCFASVLTLLGLVYVVATLVRWRKPLAPVTL